MSPGKSELLRDLGPIPPKEDVEACLDYTWRSLSWLRMKYPDSQAVQAYVLQASLELERALRENPGKPFEVVVRVRD